jgi:membrane protein
VTNEITEMTQRVTFFSAFSPVILFFLSLLPYSVVWMLFIFIYLLVPNTKVSLKSGVVAGVLAGSLYQVLQWVYVFFQIGVAKYNAVYGSFAALPLFLVWLQTSWLVVLFGAELSFAIDNAERYEFERDCLDASLRFKRMVSLRIVEQAVKQFNDGEPPISAVALSHQLETPIRLVRECLYDLVQAGILNAVGSEGDADERYQPALHPEKLTIKVVWDALDARGAQPSHLVKERELSKLNAKVAAMDRAAASSPDNVRLSEL